MAPTRAARAATLTLAVAMGLVLSGCTASGSDAASGGGAGTPTGEAGPSSDSDSSSSISGGAECLMGVWKLENETFEASMARIIREAPDVPAEVRESADVSLSGDWFVEYGPGGEYASWQDAFTMTFELDGQQVRHVQDSRDSARYHAEGDTLLLSDFEQLEWSAVMTLADVFTVQLDRSSAVASVEFFGATADVPVDDRELLDGAARYECTADSLLLHSAEDMSAGFARVG